METVSLQELADWHRDPRISKAFAAATEKQGLGVPLRVSQIGVCVETGLIHQTAVCWGFVVVTPNQYSPGWRTGCLADMAV